MILIISIKSSQSPQNAGIFHSQYPCLRTCGVPDLSMPTDTAYTNTIDKYVQFLRIKYIISPLTYFSKHCNLWIFLVINIIIHFTIFETNFNNIY